MSEWQPIETAPKDGTQILAARGDRHIGIISWTDDGWESTLLGDGYALIGEYDFPTHWMHLPPPLVFIKAFPQVAPMPQ